MLTYKFQNQVIFNTLELLKATEGHQLTAQEIINNRTYFKNHSKLKGWDYFLLDDKNTLLDMIVDALGGHKKTKEAIRRNLSKNPQHWGLRRIFIEVRNDKIFCIYCAGQDYVSETQIIRNYLKNFY